MLKRLALFALLATYLLGWPCVSKAQESRTHTKADKADKDKRVAPPTHVVIDPPLPSPPGKPEPAKSDPQPTEKPLPRFQRPEWVIVYVTVAYAFISWLTLRAMKRQADLMKRQADVVVNKDRARLTAKVNAVDANLEDVFWTTRIRIKNLGPTRAFKVVCNVWITEHSQTKCLHVGTVFRLNFPSVIQTEEIVVAEYSPNVPAIAEILNGTRTLYLEGNLSYEDVFGEERSTIFGYRWAVSQRMSDGKIIDRSEWVVEPKAGNVEL